MRKSRFRQIRWQQAGYGDEPLCYLCSVNSATTDDHVPPKALFPKKSQFEGHLLPACLTCNNRFQKDEEYVRDVFSVIADTPEANFVFETTKRSFAKLRSPIIRTKRTKFDLLRDSLGNTQQRTKSGIYLGEAATFSINQGRVARVAQKIVRGLHYHHFRAPIPPDYQFSFIFQPEENLRDELARPSPIFDQLGNILTYKANVYGEGQGALWWLLFYQSIRVIMLVEHPDLEEGEETGPKAISK